MVQPCHRWKYPIPLRGYKISAVRMHRRQIQCAPDRTRILESTVEQSGFVTGCIPRPALSGPHESDSICWLPKSMIFRSSTSSISGRSCNDLGSFDWRRQHVDDRILKLPRSCLAFVGPSVTHCLVRIIADFDSSHGTSGQPNI
jgi:hypothetical protein